MKRVETPHQVIIQQSIPFRMQYPQKQADLFDLLSRLLFYLVSGFGKVGYIAADEWNEFYTRQHRGPSVHRTVIHADYQVKRMWESLRVQTTTRRANEEDLQEGGVLAYYNPDWSDLECDRTTTSSTRGSWGDFPGDSSPQGGTAMDENVE